jgi:high-affinity nickel-transport protein
VYGLLALANLLAWLWAWGAFHGSPALLGTAFLAWMFGLRHALDADHLAAIDNVVRKLMQQKQRPLYAGLFFSLGHSTIVVLATIGVAVATTSLHRHLRAIQSVGQLLGTAISGFFLLLLALVNMGILVNVWRNIQKAQRSGALEDIPSETGPHRYGLLARAFWPLFRSIRKSVQMYPIGFLFGLGFDTASEVGLLAISAAQIARGISFWQVMALPALFTAGMVLVDTTDSVLMVGAYGWALVNPLNKLWYNLTITVASVMMALFVGGVEVTALVGSHLGLRTGFWRVVAGLNGDLTAFGLFAVGAFALCWAVSSMVFRYYRRDRALQPMEQER